MAPDVLTICPIRETSYNGWGGGMGEEGEKLVQSTHDRTRKHSNKLEPPVLYFGI